MFDGLNIDHITFLEINDLYSQGPALCVYNNAQFTKEDWQGIQMINRSVKEFDPVKIGRFGLGFKSVFHITGWYI